MKPMKYAFIVVILSLLLVVFLSGCSSDTESGNLKVIQPEQGHNDAEEDHIEAVEKESIKEPAEVMEEKVTEEKKVVELTEVIIQEFKFIPSEIKVKKGTTVTWRNEDSAPHTVESDDGFYTSDNLENSDEVQFTFNTEGAVDYHCGIHPSMKGKVIVE